MKKLLTLLTLIICIYASGQRAEEVKKLQDELNKYDNNWRINVENKVLDLYRKTQSLTTEVKNLVAKTQAQSEIITQLKIDALKDSLKIDRLEKQINYTQSFIKDSVVFVTENPKPIEVNLLGDVSSYHAAWSVVNEVYSYDASVDNYDYIYFNLTENLIPNSTYIIKFDIKTDSNALLNFWLYGTTTQRLADTSYESGSYSLEVTVTDDEKDRIGIRARNNVGGDFEITNLKVVEK